MIESHELGKKAEALAGEYLQKNGYRILARNIDTRMRTSLSLCRIGRTRIRTSTLNIAVSSARANYQ